MGFIIPASIGFSKDFLFKKKRSAPPHESSNNPLAVEPESENDARRWIFYCQIFYCGRSGGFLRRKGLING